MSSGYEPPDTPGNMKPASRRPPCEHQRTELVHLHAPPRPRTAQALSFVIGDRRVPEKNGEVDPTVFLAVSDMQLSA
jgi:hypothetical protein